MKTSFKRRLLLPRLVLWLMLLLWLLPSGHANVSVSLQPLPSLEGNLRNIAALHFMEVSSLLLSAGQRRGTAVQVLNYNTGARAFGFEERNGEVYALAYHAASDMLATVGVDGYVRLWDPLLTTLRATLGDGRQSMEAVAISPDGSLLASGQRNGDIRLWQLPSGEFLRSIPAHGSAVRALVFMPDNSTLVSVAGQSQIPLQWGDVAGNWTAVDNSLRVWDVTSGQVLQEYSEHPQGFTDVSISPNGEYIAASDSAGQVLLWSFAFGVARLEQQLELHPAAIHALRIHPSGRFFVTASDDRSLKVVALETGRLLHSLSFPGAVRTLTFNHSGDLLAAAGRSAAVHLWRIEDVVPLSAAP